MRGKAEHDGRWGARWVETTVLFFSFCGPKFTKFGMLYGSGRSLQRRFPIDDILFPSGDIRDQVAKLSEIAAIRDNAVRWAFSAIAGFLVGITVDYCFLI